MSKATILNENLESAGNIELPARYAEINPHNLYLYAKSYLASLRANTAHTKSRSTVRWLPTVLTRSLFPSFFF